MKSDVMPSRVQMEKQVFNSLVKEVKETVATGIEMNETKKPSFGLVDLWNIQRNSRSANGLLRRRTI
jgi:hypothetical protein